MPEPGVVVVAYGHPEELDRCLATLTGHRVVVVDNSSSAAVSDVAERHECTYIDPGTNLGFGSGVNLGVTVLHESNVVDVAVVNPDARLAPGCLAALRTAFDRSPELAVMSPRLTDRAGREQRVWWPFPSPSGMWREAVGLAPTREEFVIGAVMLLRGRALHEVGGFDERFFLYAEETDWQRRAVAKGWRVGVAMDAFAAHDGAGTSSDSSLRELLFHAAQEIYIRKWFGTGGWLTYRAGAMLGALVRSVIPGRSAGARRRLLLYARGPVRAAATASSASNAPDAST